VRQKIFVCFTVRREPKILRTTALATDSGVKQFQHAVSAYPYIKAAHYRISGLQVGGGFMSDQHWPEYGRRVIL
jgi:hypothetical protein